MRRPRIPLTVIGGFLGAGKTTLLNRLLAQAAGRRLAVLVNDFGAINIDRRLIASQDAGAIELTNGCVCCQIGDDLTAALIGLIESSVPPERIVIEASGVSDPWRIAQVGLADPALALDAVIVMADASAVRAQARDPLLGDTVLRQLRAADLLVLNHADRAGADECAAVHAWLDAELPGTPRCETTQAQVPPALLQAPALPHRHAPGCGCETHEHATPDAHVQAPDHGQVFETWSLSRPPVYRAAALRALLRDMPRGVLRLKGLVRTDEHGVAELQFAGRHGSLRQAGAWVGGVERDSPAKVGEALDELLAIVAIGARGALPSAALAQALRAAECSTGPAHGMRPQEQMA